LAETLGAGFALRAAGFFAEAFFLDDLAIIQEAQLAIRRQGEA
jgi:ethanolamine utilization protein EutQ (cupin superfamily)